MVYHNKCLLPSANRDPIPLSIPSLLTNSRRPDGLPSCVAVLHCRRRHAVQTAEHFVVIVTEDAGEVGRDERPAVAASTVAVFELLL